MLPALPPPILRWACGNIIIPDGPLKGQAFDPDVQPFARLFLDEVGSGKWDRFAAVGPTQTGKSLIAYVILVLYHLFAIGETVVAGVPTSDMADDKWREDFLPVIESSPKLRALLPTTGQGSRAGRVRTRVKFRNGATLRFMSGGGSDKARAAFTARVLAVTEVDGLDASGGTSREADKLKQLEGRQRAYLATGIRTYLECTASITKGRIWQEYLAGTESRIARPCPQCGAFVSPGRDCLIGWEDADTEIEARANAAWSCPNCGEAWTEAERHAANCRSVLVHKGQSIGSDGAISGPAPATRTLGFRWSAVDNHFATAADVAADEWNATRELDSENAEKELCQFVHALPHDPPGVDMTPLDVRTIMERQSRLKKGILPDGCVAITVGVDTNMRELHWAALAWLATGGGYVVDYGNENVPSDRLGITEGLKAALKSLSDYFSRGWNNPAGGSRIPDQVWIDSGWHQHTDGVYGFCNEINVNLRLGTERYRPSKGYANGHKHMSRYTAPKKWGHGSDIRYVGPGYHMSKVQRAEQLLVHMNADHWKAQFHQRLAMQIDAPLAIVLYEPSKKDEHKEFCVQSLAERQVEKFIEGKGEHIGFERIGRTKNHYLDASYAAVAAGHFHLTMARRADRPQGERQTLSQMAKEARG